MDVTEERPRLESQENEKLARVEPPSSPPPNCAICLGTCANKCFTDCCLHQFCFNCLLEWSKIKAECPLCKQPFKSIIYNIKSNNEYEEHVITNPEHEIPEDDVVEQEDSYNNFFLPNGPRPQRHFQFRTTLTVDTGSESAIQQLLLSHGLTQVQQLLLSHGSSNTLFFPSQNRFNRNPQQSIAFRRAIYQNGWWAQGSPDITGRYRDCSPTFFRENPAQTHRIQPWLFRELGALIEDYIDIFVAQQSIMELLSAYPIQSSAFRSRIIRFVRTYTDHFIHEFYNFVRSPLDMIGYDSHVRYSFRRPEHTTYHSVSDDDSDVRVIDSPNDCIYVEPRTPEVIVIHSDNSDSDVIFRTPTPPVVVDLLDSDSETESRSRDNSNVEGSPKLPIKLRLKLKKNSPKRKKKHSKRKHELISDSDSSKSKSDVSYRISDSSSSSSDESSNDAATESDWTPIKSEYRYTQPLVLKRKKVKKELSSRNKSKKKYDIKRFVLKNNKKSRRESTDYDTSSEKNYKVRKSSKKSSKHKKSKRRENEKSKRIKKRLKVDVESSSDESDCSKCANDDINDNLDTSEDEKIKETKETIEKRPETKENNEKSKEEITASIPLSLLPFLPFLNNKEQQEKSKSPEEFSMDVAGPSSGMAGPSKGLPSVIVQGNSMWYSRPDLDETSSNNSD